MCHDQATDSVETQADVRDTGLRKPMRTILLTATVCLLCFAARFSPAQTSMELTRWREFSSAKQSNILGSRTASVESVQRGGFIVFGEGEFARLSSSLVHTTSLEGKEFCQGFAMYDFEDGSSILAKIDIAGDPKTKQIGTIIFLSGTKRFKGITGRGTITAWVPSRGDMYADVEASYSVAKSQAQ
jgi:hypothetical protein